MSNSFYCPFLKKEVSIQVCKEFKDCIECIEWHIYNHEEVARKIKQTSNS